MTCNFLRYYAWQRMPRLIFFPDILPDFYAFLSDVCQIGSHGGDPETTTVERFAAFVKL